MIPRLFLLIGLLAILSACTMEPSREAIPATQYDLYRLCQVIAVNTASDAVTLNTMQMLHPEAGIVVDAVSPDYCRMFWPYDFPPPAHDLQD